ncbi:hypothetical protein ABW365_06690 [Enterococcus avium]
MVTLQIGSKTINKRNVFRYIWYFVPLGIVCLMGFMDSSNDSLNTAFVSVSTVGICSAGVMGLPLALSSYRERKILKRYQVTPISPIQLLLAHLLFCFTISIV